MFPLFLQLMRFGVTGVISTLADVMLLKSLLIIHVNEQVAIIVAFTLGVIVGYYMHRKFTFRQEINAHVQEFTRYIIVVFFNLFLTILTIYIVRDLFGLSVMQGKLISIPLVAASGFILGRLFIFRPTSAK